MEEMPDDGYDKVEAYEESSLRVEIRSKVSTLINFYMKVEYIFPIRNLMKIIVNLIVYFIFNIGFND